MFSSIEYYLLQNSVSERVYQKDKAGSRVCSRNDTNTLSQISVNPSEDDTNVYPPSSASFEPGKDEHMATARNAHVRYMFYNVG